MNPAPFVVETSNGHFTDKELRQYNIQLLKDSVLYDTTIYLEDTDNIYFYLNLRESARRARVLGYGSLCNALMKALGRQPIASQLYAYDKPAHRRVNELRYDSFALPPNPYLHSTPTPQSQKSQ